MRGAEGRTGVVGLAFEPGGVGREGDDGVSFAGVAGSSVAGVGLRLGGRVGLRAGRDRSDLDLPARADAGGQQEWTAAPGRCSASPGSTVEGTTTGGVAFAPDGGRATTSPPNGLCSSVGSEPSAFTRATLSAIACGTGSSVGRLDGCGRGVARGGLGLDEGFGAAGGAWHDLRRRDRRRLAGPAQQLARACGP